MQAAVNGITLEYETFGKAEAPALLLIMGLGAQMLLWPESFCQALAQAGHYVIRFDNRDIGLSTHMSNAGRPNVLRASLRSRLKLSVPSAYTLRDMAMDAIGLLDALKIKQAHIVGASMGGMIAQILSAEHPERVSSLTLIMTTSGSARLPQAKLGLQLRLARGPGARDREALIAYGMRTWRLIGSQGRLAANDAELRSKVAATFDRSFYPVGAARQLVAIIANGSRTHLLGRITAPTLIIHGTDDPLIPAPAAKDLHQRIKGSKLEMMEGMAHDLPGPLLPKFVSLISGHARGSKPKAPQQVAVA